MIRISMLCSFMIVTSLTAISESDSEDFYDEQAVGIVSVPVERFSEYAGAISDMMHEDAELQYGEQVSVDLEEWEGLDLYEDSDEENDLESNQEKERLLQEHQEMFMACERDIFQSTLSFLEDRGYRQWRKKYLRLMKEKKKRPSQAVPLLADYMFEDPNYEYAASELLEYIRRKLCPNWSDYYGSEHMIVESRICGNLSLYYRDKFNRLVETTDPQEPTASLFMALKKCAGYLASDPDGSWDDVECPWLYIYEFSRRHLRRYALWYLKEKVVPIELQDITLNVLQRANAFFRTVSYGWVDNSYDVLHLLQKQKFRGFSVTKPNGKKQHIWIKFPYEVRIKKAWNKTLDKEVGEVTVALIEEDPFAHEQVHGSLQISTIISRDNSGEVLKIGADEQGTVLVPAFFKGDKYKKMWDVQDVTKRRSLMNRAHHQIDLSCMDFAKADKFMMPTTKKKS